MKKSLTLALAAATLGGGALSVSSSESLLSIDLQTQLK